MKRITPLFATVILFVVLVAFNSKAPAPFESALLEGNWTYRSLHNAPANTPFSNLEFATAIMRFKKISGDSISGILDMGTGYALQLKGKITTCNGSTTFYIEGSGIPNSNTANWQYDYQGYVVPKWKNGIQQADACVGSVIRSKPHGNAKAGQTASFYMVRQ
ncbi:MAG: hypothetical protein ABIN01_22920 [Ferruginibacter sp.]